MKGTGPTRQVDDLAPAGMTSVSPVASARGSLEWGSRPSALRMAPSPALLDAAEPLVALGRLRLPRRVVCLDAQASSAGELGSISAEASLIHQLNAGE